MTTTTNRKTGKKKATDKRPATAKKRVKSDPPPRGAISSKAGKQASGTRSGGRVVDGVKRTPGNESAAPAISPQKPTTAVKPAAGRGRRTPPRIALVNKPEAAEIAKAVQDLPTSRNHVCWKKNGKLYELYFRVDGRTPLLYRVPADSPIDEKTGCREVDASGSVTGVFHIKQSIKQLTGKTPAQIGISMPPDRGAPKARTSATSKTTGGKADAKPRKKRKGLSGLNAAAQVLAKAKEPLNAKTIAERAIAAGWKTNGATPHATLYAAMIREIAAKGKEARFRKVDKGRFTAAGKGA